MARKFRNQVVNLKSVLLIRLSLQKEESLSLENQERLSEIFQLTSNSWTVNSANLA